MDEARSGSVLAGAQEPHNPTARNAPEEHTSPDVNTNGSNADLMEIDDVETEDVDKTEDVEKTDPIPDLVDLSDGDLMDPTDVKTTDHSPDGLMEVDTETPTVVQAKPFTEKRAAVEERNGEIEFRVVNNDGNPESTVILTGLNNLIQVQLKNMSAEYITRLVYDRAHLSMAIVKKDLQVIGGVTFREFRDRKFAEVVFLAIAPDYVVKGYGSYLMCHLKDYVKASSPIMHLLTYADNHAVRYFKKHGFTEEIELDKSIWKGCLKDYEGATLMHCAMLPRIRYLEADRMLYNQKQFVLEKHRAMTGNHIIHPPPAQWANGNITPIDPMSIPAIVAAGWTPNQERLALGPNRGPHFNELRIFLNRIKAHEDAWPFLEPVDVKEVPLYYRYIESPMDLSTIEGKLDRNVYRLPKQLVDDVKLIFKNCRRFNGSWTDYCKCARRLEDYMWDLIDDMKDIPEWLVLADN